MDNQNNAIKQTKRSEIPFSHQVMFRLVMEKPELCKRTLELLMDCEIAELQYLEPEKSIEAKLTTKGIRLDVYIRDTAGNAYDLEMQASDMDKGALGKRARYYQSLIDVDSLKKGQFYSTLGPSVVLFICKFDPFGKKLPKYSFSNRCHEDNTVDLKDDTLKVIFNSTGSREHVNQDLANFMDYVNTGVASDEFTKMLNDEVIKIRNDDRKVEFIMNWEQQQMEAEAKGMKKGIAQGRAEGKAEGRAEGRVEGKAEGIAEATELINKLNALLISAKRFEDLERSTVDKEFQKQLLAEFRLE